ncbi:LPXTG cell wall anchor domain-containing protein [Streptomyces sp. NPDC086838]|uniref:LPXTG cell wall anchor domain-containing protein n=1 Tax=Streptomyces sp. NPDC086838 TaxID=3365762 RepID=UPI00382D23F1
MKIRRILAVAVAVAVTTPAALLSVTPAFADSKPAAEAQAEPTIEELEKAAAEAQKVYDKAVAAQKAGYEVLETALSDEAPLAVAAKAARKKADDAAAARIAADQAVTDAKAALAALPDTATDAERTEAEKAVTGAETAAAAAATAEADAKTAAAEAGTTSDDARVAAARAYGVLQKAVDDALAVKTAADETLAKAREEEGGPDCVPANLRVTVSGLPASVVAGTSTTFSLRVKNGTDKTLDAVTTYANVHTTDTSGLKTTDRYMHLQWSTAASPKWHAVAKDHSIGIGALKAGAQTDVKLRLTADAKAPAGNGVVLTTVDYVNKDGSCGGDPGMDASAFKVKAAGSGTGTTGGSGTGGSTGSTGDAGSTGTSGTTGSTGASGQQAQGSASDEASTGGGLASTGASDATVPLGIAGAAAVALGGAAVLVVRRRRAGAGA